MNNVEYVYNTDTDQKQVGEECWNILSVWTLDLIAVVTLQTFT